MKKVLGLLTLIVFLFGCGAAATQSEFWKHDSMYKNWDHTKFSWAGYRSTMKEDQKKSVEQGWWGLEVPYIPAK